MTGAIMLDLNLLRPAQVPLSVRLATAQYALELFLSWRDTPGKLPPQDIQEGIERFWRWTSGKEIPPWWPLPYGDRLQGVTPRTARGILLAAQAAGMERAALAKADAE